MVQKRDTAELLEDLAAVRQEMAAENEVAHFFTESLDLLCIAGFDGHFKRLNPAWTSRLGRSLEELTARPLLDFVHPEDREATRAAVETLAKGRKALLFENRYRHQDGSYRWLQWKAWTGVGRQRIYAAARDVTRQKRLEREILEILDCEQERLGRELHDGLCQTLAGIAALSTTLSRRLARNSEGAAAGAAKEITELLNEAIAEARDLARGLGPLGLEEADLEAALEALALGSARQFRVSCMLACERPFPRLRQEVAEHLYRIAQEAVSNALRHGKGDRIEISLDSEAGKGLLSVRCNGVGIPYDSPEPHGIGLHTMTYRARLIGGSLEFRRRQPRGTTVSCAFPLPVTTDTSDNPDHDSDHT